jgi:uncharacterized coiled-coil DUF342 family protein
METATIYDYPETILKHEEELDELGVLMKEVITSQAKLNTHVCVLSSKIDSLVENSDKLNKSIEQMKEIIVALADKIFKNELF